MIKNQKQEGITVSDELDLDDAQFLSELATEAHSADFEENQIVTFKNISEKNQTPSHKSQVDYEYDRAARREQAQREWRENNRPQRKHSNEKEVTQREGQLIIRIRELQKICLQINEDNSRLRNEAAKSAEHICLPGKVQDLEWKEDCEQSMANLQDLQADFQDLALDIEDYRRMLIRYSEKNQQRTQFLQKKNEDMSSELNKLVRINKQFTDQDVKRTNYIKQIEQENQNLENTVFRLQKQNDHEKERSRDFTDLTSMSSRVSYISRKDESFNRKVNSEMEGLIEKLVKELKHEQSKNRRNTIELKRVSEEILKLETEIKEKNYRIYELEMNVLALTKTLNQQNVEKHSNYFQPSEILKTSPLQIEQINGFPASMKRSLIQDENGKSRKSPSLSRKQEQIDKHDSQYLRSQPKTSREVLRNSEPVKTFQRFSMKNLVNKEIQVRHSQKLVLICRIIELYAKKILQGNYQNIIIEDIQIYNFDPENLRTLRVRAKVATEEEEADASEESLLWNMVFIVDTLLNQIEGTDSENESPCQLNLPYVMEETLARNSREEKYKYLQNIIQEIEKDQGL